MMRKSWIDKGDTVALTWQCALEGVSRASVYPYLLRGIPIDRPNQVWSTDITYIRLAKGFAYLVAIIDWYSRKVLSWRISNSMEAVNCVDCVEDA